MYVVENNVTGKTKEVHAVQMRAYAESSLVIGAEVEDAFEIFKHQGEYEMADVVGIGQDPERPEEYRVQVTWVGLEDEESTWEPVSTIYEHAPK